MRGTGQGDPGAPGRTPPLFGPVHLNGDGGATAFSSSSTRAPALGAPIKPTTRPTTTSRLIAASLPPSPVFLWPRFYLAGWGEGVLQLPDDPGRAWSPWARGLIDACRVEADGTARHRPATDATVAGRVPPPSLAPKFAPWAQFAFPASVGTPRNLTTVSVFVSMIAMWSDDPVQGRATVVSESTRAPGRVGGRVSASLPVAAVHAASGRSQADRTHLVRRPGDSVFSTR